MYAFGNVFSGGNIFKTGGIYVITSEPDCEIYLDGKLKKTSNFFQRSFLIKNLSAKKYSIYVKKAGLNSWSKEVSVFDSLVTEVTPFMIPEKVELREITKTVDSVVSVGTTTSTSTKKNVEYQDVLKLFNTKDISTNIKQKTIATTSVSSIVFGTVENPLLYRNIGIWKDGNKVYASWLGKIDSIVDDFCDGGKCNPMIEVFDFQKSVRKLDFFLGDRQAIIALSDNCISAVEIQINKEKKAQKIYCGEKVDMFLANNSYLYIKDGEFLFEAIL
jgi:hypothetical protein